MKTMTIPVPDDLLTLLQQSPLGNRPPADQVRIALAALLLRQGSISTGKAAELSGEPRAVFEQLLVQMGIPLVYYDEAEYERDLQGIARAKAQTGIV
ncbi:MAG: UPF0175 family protein [Dehalococcoidia bacterium]